MSGDGFLSRWSRRKLQAEPVTQAQEPAGEQLPVAPDEPTPLSEEEALAQLNLPALDSITAETDIRAFLDARVPQLLRAAALRKAWALDPAIRDYLDPAREYAYDWNTPGGIPGYDALDSGADPRQLIERLFGGGETQSAKLPQPVAPQPAEIGVSDDAAAQEKPESPLPLRLSAQTPERSDILENAQVVAKETIPAPQQKAHEKPIELMQKRRHGGAIPGFEPI